MASTPLARESRAQHRPAPGSLPSVTVTDAGEPSPLTLVGLELSLATASLDDLDRVAQTLEPAWLDEQFAAFDATEEAALLATCCRRELFLLTRAPWEVDRWRASLPGRASNWQVRFGRDAVRHLYLVAGGRESMVVGEKEVRQQVRTAAGSSRSRHRLRLVRDLLQGASDAADEAVPAVPRSRSVAALAATRVLELSGRPFPRVLVVGSGAVGREVAELLASSASVTILYHHRPPDERFLRTTGARAARLESLPAEIGLADAVVTATKSAGRCVRASDLPSRRPIILIDLGVPRNIEPEARRLPNVRLVDVAELRSRSVPEDDASVDRALLASADRFAARLELLALEPWVAAMRRRAEGLRAAELEVARPFLGALTAEQQAAVDRLTRRLVHRLLAGPTERLRAVPAGEDGDRLRRFALELLRPDPAEP